MIPRDEVLLWFGGKCDVREVIGAQLHVEPERIVLTRGEFGKLRADGVSFNLSYAGTRQIVALSSGEDGNRIGVDLVDVAGLREMGAPDCRDLLVDHFPGFYRAGFSDEECVDAFARLWTQCEAVLKALGVGLNAGGLPVGCCSLDARVDEWREILVGGERFGILDFRMGEGLHAAVVVIGVGRRVRWVG